MDRSHNYCSHRLHHLTISFLFLFLLISSSTYVKFIAEGRTICEPLCHSQKVKEEKVILRGQMIGSRPPRCERRCSSCAHCEAIQVPTNPQFKTGTKKNSSSIHEYYSRGNDDSSNYKPMSWKCKCGNSIFNP